MPLDSGSEISAPALQSYRASERGDVIQPVAPVEPVTPPPAPTGPATVVPTGPVSTGPSVTGPANTGATGPDPMIAQLQAQLAALQAQINSNSALAQANAAQQKQNAIAFLSTTFTDYGLSGDIASAITNLVQQGYTADTIQMMAQDPNSKDPLAVAFKQRFPANAARLQAGLPVLSPGEYIATERSYAQVLQAYGLPSNFATNKEIFTKLLTKDVSPTELNTRVTTAKQVIENTDPTVTQQLQTYYGLSQGDMIAHVLDPSVATPIIQKQIAAAEIGSAAAKQGYGVNATTAENLFGQGITQAQAEQGFKSVAYNVTPMQTLAARYGGDAGVQGQNLVASTFGTAGSAYAEQQIKALTQQEINQFSGSSGAGKGSLMGSEAGQQ